MEGFIKAYYKPEEDLERWLREQHQVHLMFLRHRPECACDLCFVPGPPTHHHTPPYGERERERERESCMQMLSRIYGCKFTRTRFAFMRSFAMSPTRQYYSSKQLSGLVASLPLPKKSKERASRLVDELKGCVHSLRESSSDCERAVAIALTAPMLCARLATEYPYSCALSHARSPREG